MSYLIQQMWLCLLLAALLGALIGWWLAKSSCRSKLNDLDASWRRKLDDQDKNYSRKLEDASTPAAAGTAATMISIAEQTSYEVEEVEGIGKSFGQKLRDMGISTTEQLLNQCCNMNGRVTVAEHVGIEDFVVRKWASISDLLRLSGVEGQFSELMVYAGIDSVQDLGQQNAGALHSKLSATNQEQNRVKTILDESSLDLMISQAKSLKTIMQDT
jgi:hypothetical protein